ncbi:lycopene cyclase [Aeromicrobium flavum]|uniref:Lycopene cyclase n=1 Tax=Aeromicrobium flavum TaxID=416568 RepID=A0A512HU78_9ACTN|nr:lycopene cyclase domain-containing protein [Aeromicrobium flavum]GEO88994.1 lycopene cyclase [Aeromicrobium flavum]
MTYLGLAAIFVAATVPVLVAAVVLRRPDRRWWAVTGLTGLALCVLTAVFDSIMIAADLFRFDESSLTGIHVGLAPIEDFAWPIAVTILVSSLSLLLDRPRERA